MAGYGIETPVEVAGLKRVRFLVVRQISKQKHELEETKSEN